MSRSADTAPANGRGEQPPSARTRLRLVAPGVALGVVVGGLSIAVCQVLPPSLLRSDVMVALVAGALVANTPIHRLFGLELGTDGSSARHAHGLHALGHWLLRAAIVMMGLRVEASFFEPDHVVLIATVTAATIPSAFFVAHACAGAMGVALPLADLISAGTMICGASAATAVAPVVGAKRSDLAIAMATIFLFSTFALLAFRPVASLAGLDAVSSGLWAGLAVNDLSSAVAVGQQMGGPGAIMATTSKATRVLLLTPTILAFGLLRSPGGSKSGEGFVKRIVAVLPLYMLGYAAMAMVRVAGDALWARHQEWYYVRVANDQFVRGAIVIVAASIGMQVDVRRFLGVGGRAIVVGAAASLWTAALSLAMIVSASRGAFGASIAIGAGGLFVATLAYARRRRTADEAAPPSPPTRSRAERLARAFQIAILALMVAVPLGLGGMKAISLSRRRERARRPMPEVTIPPRVAELRSRVFSPRCPPGMIEIEGGSFRMGSEDGFEDDELPVHTVEVQSYCLAATEITVAEYLLCVAAGKCTPPDNTSAWPDLSEGDAEHWDPLCNGNRPERLDHPMNCIDWVQLTAYCAAQGYRLPTEREWEYAARGGAEQRTFPWGEQKPEDASVANLCGTECSAYVTGKLRPWTYLYNDDDHWVGTAPVASFPRGVNRWGVYDLTGNVTEFLSSPYCPYPETSCDTDRRVARGTGFLGNWMAKIRIARRNRDVTWHRSPDAGARCAVDRPR